LQNNINLDLHYNLTEHITVCYSQRRISSIDFFIRQSAWWQFIVVCGSGIERYWFFFFLWGRS